MSPIPKLHSNSFSSAFTQYNEKGKGKGRLPIPVTSNSYSHKTSKANKRKFKRISGICPFLGLILLISWFGYPFIPSFNRISSPSIHPAVQSLLNKSNTDNDKNQYYVNNTVEDVNQKEAYVTFLSSISDPNYLLSTRFLIYQLLNDPLTLDKSQSRDVVVITTPEINQETIKLLESDGAKIKKVNLLDGFDLPNEINDHWKDQYTKLNIFNMTEYSKILYLDNDIFLLKSFEDIWESSLLNHQSPLGGIGETSKTLLRNSDLRKEPPSSILPKEKDYLNAGFMLIKPSIELFEELKQVKGYDTFYMEQALINHYFDWNGNHPWTPLNHKFVSHFPKPSDLVEGYYSLHAKMWKDPVDEIVKDAWRDRIIKMEDFWRSQNRT
ncbi:uncharacterized protein I206_102458 [Kwoniella pini CBS 10737]|uniref:Glycosyltransferase family 8 protein n=1 Tax=Kwoniella pini CBS 10737 TaxID=1296096 RepID=A0A1B9I5E3_9TREE|nr:uncharacterized protein I206_02808 [Kwoniella pini CBS 10737]OCF50752.1 hypothetical protein I206_02808 [Kwoniella pini CBS 10737]